MFEGEDDDKWLKDYGGRRVELRENGLVSFLCDILSY